MDVYFYWAGQDFDYANYLAISSAALFADGRRVTVLTDGPPVDNRHFEQLWLLPGVHIQPLVLKEVMEARHVALYKSMRFVAHRADLIRFIMLYQHGGLYLDTDTLTCKALGALPETLLLDDGKIIHIGILGLPQRYRLLNQMLESLAQMSEADLAVYQSIVYRWTALVRQLEPPPPFSDLGAFFPVHWKAWERIFTPDELAEQAPHIHILHHYGYFSRQYTATMDEQWMADHDCLFSRLARPVVQALGANRTPYGTSCAAELATDNNKGEKC